VIVLAKLVSSGGQRPSIAQLAIVDVMPIDEDVLRFSNRWYAPAIESAQTLSIGGSEIRIVSPVYFVATKLEAFHGRGADDMAMSHDLEDIVTLVDGLRTIAAMP